METKEFSLNDVEVIKDNDKLTTDYLSEILGGKDQVMGCNCKCGTNTASLGSSKEKVE